MNSSKIGVRKPRRIGPAGNIAKPYVQSRATLQPTGDGKRWLAPGMIEQAQAKWRASRLTNPNGY